MFKGFTLRGVDVAAQVQLGCALVVMDRRSSPTVAGTVVRSHGRDVRPFTGDQIADLLKSGPVFQRAGKMPTW